MTDLDGTDDNDLFADTDDDSGNDGSGAADDAPAPQSDSGSADSPDPKDARIAALMSRAQKAEAALAKATKGKDGAVDGQTNDQTDTGTDGAGANVTEMEQYWASRTREDIFKRQGLDKYFDSPDVVEGNSLAAMRASAERLKKVADKAMSTARQEAFARAGIDPDIGGSAPGKPIDWAGISDEEFDKQFEKALNGV